MKFSQICKVRTRNTPSPPWVSESTALALFLSSLAHSPPSLSLGANVGQAAGMMGSSWGSPLGKLQVSPLSQAQDKAIEYGAASGAKPEPEGPAGPCQFLPGSRDPFESLLEDALAGAHSLRCNFPRELMS